MSLPRRTRTHILEDLSVRKFESLLPGEWIYRIPSHDYGIDGEVEIVNSQGYTTGKKFLVQLKATDEKNVTKSLKLRMKNKSLNYFKQLKTPILIVRYLASSDSIYTRWHYSLNPNDDTKAEKSFCMSFQEKDKWTERSAEKILNDIDAYHLLNQQVLRNPIDVAISIDSRSSLSNFTVQFASKLIESAKHSQSPFAFSITPSVNEQSTSFIKIFKKEFYVNLGGVGSFRANFNPPSSPEDLAPIIANIYVGLAVILQNLNHIREAEELYDNYLETSNYSDKEFVVLSYITTKVQLKKISDVLDYIVKMERKATLDSKDGVKVTLVALATLTRLVPKKQVEFLVTTYLELIEIAHDPFICATYYYNIGNCLKHEDRYREAIRYYIKAAKANPDYKLRTYWIKELAGLFFLIGKYSISSELYSQAIQSEGTPENHVLYADSLMLAGKYKQALEELDEYRSKLKIRDSEWCLKAVCLEYTINKLEIEEQIRQGNAGQEFLKKASEEELHYYLKNNNALCPDTQYFIATKLSKKEQFEEACFCFLLSAFADEHYKPAWLDAIACAFNTQDNCLFMHVIEVASRKFGSQIISDFISAFPSSHTVLNDLALALIQHCEEYIETFTDKKTEVRFGDSKLPHSIKF
jgi:tetratricopeptide (TPR) repeat protein